VATNQDLLRAFRSREVKQVKEERKTAASYFGIAIASLWCIMQVAAGVFVQRPSWLELERAEAPFV
jgi:hypothetical protein